LKAATRPRYAREWLIALRFVPLGLLAVVLLREKPWTVSLAAGAPFTVAAAILINVAFSLPMRAARWRIALVDPPPFREVLAATTEGLLASAALGFGSGDVVRAARLQRGDGRRFAVDYGCTWAERGAEALALALLVFVAALVADLGPVALALAGLGVAIYAMALAAGRFVVPRLGGWPRVQRALASGLEASTPRRVAAISALALLGWSVEIVMLLLFQQAFGIPTSVATALVTLVGIQAAIAIPAVPGRFGIYEAGVAGALVLCGTPRDVALSYAVTFHLSHVVPVAIVATAVFLYRSRRYRTTPARTSI
jgi:uncharacterized membrane protein YbhN (UPF0104 family)